MKITNELLKEAIDYAEECGGASIISLMNRFNINLHHSDVLMDVLIINGIIEDYDSSPICKFLNRGHADLFQKDEPTVTMRTESEIRERIKELEQQWLDMSNNKTDPESYRMHKLSTMSAEITAHKWVLNEKV